ncbi:DNA mismatch repair protein Mlh3 [Nephila pilipes]|uniref:DNA mismatch repair protein Mlh3 n=1 Tax=Nephila pilipes TaxID=299642 RepID=A0A8X6TGX9_NEPPI|nr:DNA mismatch repair protein Mlh3 [Nephila pilipes]
MQGGMKIHVLDSNVVKKLRSDLAFISVSHCVEELVWNSIDARATCIAVRLNLPFYKIQVIDNGDGIPSDQMDLVGKRYATSKCHSINDLQNLQYGGFRGEALFSLKDISSNLMIESRALECPETYCKIFSHGKSRNTTISINSRPSKGTTVTVFDFMYNRPVRRSATSDAINLEETCKLLQSIALIHPDISFSLMNEATGEMCLQFKKCSSLYFAFVQLFGKEKARNLKTLDHHSENYKISGCISTGCFPSKNYQFLYVNRRLILKTRLHKLINNLLNKFLSGKRKSECDILSSTPQILSPSKNQYYAFILNITCPRDIYDTVFDRRRTMVEFSEWEKVSNAVHDSLVGFLKSEGLLSDSSEKTDNQCLNLRDAESKNSLLSLGVDNFRNGIFSHAVKRLNVTAENSDNPTEVLTNEASTSEEYGQLNSLRVVEPGLSVPVKDGTITMPFVDQKNVYTINDNNVRGDHIAKAPVTKSNYADKNFIYLKNSNVNTSIFADLKRTNDGCKILEKDSCSLRESPSTSDIESPFKISSNSIFPTHNAIKLTVPIKSTLSLLVKERRGSDALQKLKEKYLYVPQNKNKAFSMLNKSVSHSVEESRVFSSKTHNQICNDSSNYNAIICDEVDNVNYKETESMHVVKNKKECKVASKYTFEKVSSMSPLKRIRRCKNLKALSADKSNQGTKITGNIINETIQTDSLLKRNNSENSKSLTFAEKSIVKDFSYLKSFQTLHDEMDCDVVLQERNEGENSSMHISDSTHVRYSKFKKSKHFDSLQEKLNIIDKTPVHIFNNAAIKKSLFESKKDERKGNSLLKKLQTYDKSIMPQSHIDLHELKCNEKTVDCEFASNTFELKKISHSKTLTDHITDVSDIQTSEMQNEPKKFIDCSDLESVNQELHIRNNNVPTEELNFLQSKKFCNFETHAEHNNFLLNPLNNADIMHSPFIHYKNLQCSESSDYSITKRFNSFVNNCFSANSSPVSVISATSSNLNSNIDVEESTSINPSPVISSLESEKCKPASFSESSLTVDCYTVESEMNISARDSVINDKCSSLQESSDIPKSDSTSSTFSSLNQKDMIFANANLLKNALSEELKLNFTSGNYTNKDSSLCKVSVTDISHMDNKTTCASTNLPSNILPSTCSSDASLVYFHKQNLESTVVQSCESNSSHHESLLNQNEERRWMCKMNESNQQVAYIDLVTGNSSYFAPYNVEEKQSINEESVLDHVKKPHFFLTHDFSPFIPESSSSRDYLDVSNEMCNLQTDLNNYIEQKETFDWHRKWRYPGKEVSSTDGIQNMFKKWENPMFDNPSEVNNLEKSQISTSLSHILILNSYRFTQSSLNSLKVIGQVDCKFIACIIQDFNNNFQNKNLLVLFDQHAVHERVRLEELIEDLFEIRENKKTVKTVPISPHINITLEPEEMRLLHSYRLSLKDVGFDTYYTDEENIVHVSSLPSCLVNKENNQLKRRLPDTVSVVEKIIKEWLDLLMQTRSVSSVLPKTLSAVLNSQACRGAVKFGDPLNLPQCVDLLAALSKCKLPFQCAHGRPSIAPILDLSKIESLNKKRSVPKLWKLRKLFAE